MNTGWCNAKVITMLTSNLNPHRDHYDEFFFREPSRELEWLIPRGTHIRLKTNLSTKRWTYDEFMTHA